MKYKVTFPVEHEGFNRLNVIKALCQLIPGSGLLSARDLTFNYAPQTLDFEYGGDFYDAIHTLLTNGVQIDESDIYVAHSSTKQSNENSTSITVEDLHSVLELAVINRNYSVAKAVIELIQKKQQ